MESSSFGIFYQQLFLGESSPLWDGYRDCQTLRGKWRGSRTSLCILWAGTNFNQRSFIGGNLLWYTGPGDYTGNYSLRSLVLYKTIQDVVQTFKQETETAFSFIWLDSRYCLLGCGTLLLESVSSDTSMDLRFYIRCAAVILVCW